MHYHNPSTASISSSHYNELVDVVHAEITLPFFVVDQKKKINELIIYYPKIQNIAVKAQQLIITFSVNRQKNQPKQLNPTNINKNKNRKLQKRKNIPPASGAKTLAPWSSNGGVVFFWKYGVSFTWNIPETIKFCTVEQFYTQRRTDFVKVTTTERPSKNTKVKPMKARKQILNKHLQRLIKNH